MEPPQPTWTRLRLPRWLWGGDISSFITECGWIGHPNGTEGEWNVALAERVSNSRMLKVTTVATGLNAHDTEGFGRRLARLAPAAHLGPDGRFAREVAAERERLRAVPGRPAEFFNIKLSLITSTHLELPSVAQRNFADELLPKFPDAGLQLLQISSGLITRSGAGRVLLQLDDSDERPELPDTAYEHPVFGSALHLSDGIAVGLSPYLSPLLLSHTPHVWGFDVPRAGGSLILTLGTAPLGRSVEPTDLLHLFSPHSSPATPATTPPPMTGRQQRDTVAWWIDRLDALFTETFDPVNVSPDGVFSPRRAIELQLSVEQLFRTVQSLSTHDRDPIARRALFFDALDTIEGLTSLSAVTMYEHKHAQRRLNVLRTALPRAVGPVLLPRAEAAVAALRELQDGFFLPSRKTPTGLRVPRKDGHEETISRNRAAALWLRGLRNAGHGFTPDPSHRDDEDRRAVLLTAHNGALPHKVPDLAYLYLLDLLVHPETLLSWPKGSRINAWKRKG